jgi:hypothetical protein
MANPDFRCPAWKAKKKPRFLGPLPTYVALGWSNKKADGSRNKGAADMLVDVETCLASQSGLRQRAAKL